METKAETHFSEKLATFFRSIRADRGKERDYFIENLSMLVASGMPILSAVGTLREEIASPSLRKALQTLADDVEAGVPLWRALDRTKLFQPHTISLVRIGEESGKLSANLKLIAVQEEKDKVLRGKIMGAILYPLLVLGLTAGVGIAISWFILPRLATVFDQLNVELPTLTRYIIGLGQFLGAYGLIVFPVVIGLFAVIFYFVFYFSKTKFLGQYFLFSLPGIGRLLLEVEIARFGYLLGTLLDAGLPATQALESLYVAADFPQYKKLYKHLQENVEEGNSLQKSFSTYPKVRSLIPLSIVRLIGAGEQSGNLSEVLLRVSTVYEQKTDNTAKNLTVLLEPILLVIVWGGVVLVALAVIMPIYNLIGGFNGGTTQQPEVQSVLPDSSTENVRTLDEQVSSSPADTVSESSDAVGTESGLGTVLVQDTGLGYLNVRTGPSATSEKVTEVHPGEEFQYFSEEEGWFEILLTNGEYGWVAGGYVEVSPYAEAL